MLDRGGQGSEQLLLLSHRGQEPLIVLFQRLDIALIGIGKQVGCLMYPPIRLVDGREEAVSYRQSCSYHVVEAAEFGRKPLFCSTRAIESEIS
jgi:hypothetical protein